MYQSKEGYCYNPCFQPDNDCIIGISDIFDYSIIRLFRAKKWHTFFISVGRFYSFKIKSETYILFLYRDTYGKEKYYSDFTDSNFIFVFTHQELILINSIFDTTVYSWKIPIKENLEIYYKTVDVKGMVSTVDLFIFSDFTSQNTHSEYADFLKPLHLIRIPITNDSYIVLEIEEKGEDFFPTLKIALYLFS